MMQLKGKKIAILVAEGVEDLEYYVPLMRLQEEGAVVQSAGINMKTVRGKNGLEIIPDTLIESLKIDELNGLVIPGGWAPDKLRRYQGVTDFVQAFYQAGKPIGIICHGGLVAISAKIVDGHKVTGSLGIKDDLINAGGIWVDEPAFSEGNLIWGRIVADIPAFCRELISVFSKR